MNEITITLDRKTGIYHVSDSKYGSSTTTDSLEYALTWGLPSFGESIIIHYRSLT